MSLPNVFQNLNESLTKSAGGNTVFGEPVAAGEKKIIPVARIVLGFGGGSGTSNRSSSESRGQEGMGGGGGVIAVPKGVVEITPEGTRWIPFGQRKRVVLAFAAGALLGAVGLLMRPRLR